MECFPLILNIKNYNAEACRQKRSLVEGKEKCCILGENTGSPGQQAPDGNQMEDDRRGKLLL